MVGALVGVLVGAETGSSEGACVGSSVTVGQALDDSLGRLVFVSGLFVLIEGCSVLLGHFVLDFFGSLMVFLGPLVRSLLLFFGVGAGLVVGRGKVGAAVATRHVAVVAGTIETCGQDIESAMCQMGPKESEQCNRTEVENDVRDCPNSRTYHFKESHDITTFNDGPRVAILVE